MKEYNILEKSFGPAGSFAGIFIFIIGLVASFFAWAGLVLVFIGAFVGFTHSAAQIDTGKKRIRMSYTLFGFIKTGQWFDIEADMKLGVEKSTSAFRTYSRSNQILNHDNLDYLIVWYTATNKEIMHLKRFPTAEAAYEELDQMAAKLDLKRKQSGVLNQS